MKKFIQIFLYLVLASTFFSNMACTQKKEIQRTVLVINDVVDKEHSTELNGYLSQMMQIFKEHGGKPIGRYKTIERISGSQTPEMIAMISFENAEAIKTMVDGDKYKSLSELRDRAFSDLKIVICTELN